MTVVWKRCAVSAMGVGVLLLAGCSPNTSDNNASEAAKKVAAKPEPVTAMKAFSPMYTAAVKWAPDAVVLRLTSKDLPGYTNAEGKAAEWDGTFASASLRSYREDSYAIASNPPAIYKGLTAGMKMAWGGPTRDMMPIDASNFSVDSDAAYKAAAADPGYVEWQKKNPDKKLTMMQLGKVFKFPVPVWYLVWGDLKDGYGVYVDASSGKVLKNSK